MYGRDWGWVLARGVLAMAIGLMLIALPIESAETLVMLVGLFTVVSGLLTLASALSLRGLGWGFAFSGGLLTLALGALALLWPGVITAVLMYVIAAYALLFGLIKLLGGVALPAGGRIRTTAIVLGLVSIVLAVLLFANPNAGVVAAAWLIGGYLLVTGAIRVYYAIACRDSLCQASAAVR